jgi:hypothetical protein
MLSPMLRWLATIALGLALTLPARADDHFEAKVRPVLADVCSRCHGPAKASGGLRVDSREALLKGGDSGPALVPGDPGRSLIVRALRHEEGVSPMPPKSPRNAARAADFAAWVKAGAPWGKAVAVGKGEKHWAFEPLAKAPGSIDGYLEAALARKGVKAAGPADRRTLLRRVTYGLTGLPPAPEEVEAFLHDERPDAYERVVERLLASPAYGERWGRHWLDLARYADSAGENSDHPLPHAWRYRNWVIDAFNAGMPYDQMIREQIAGDILASRGPPELAAGRIIATGYLAIARRFGHDIDKDHHLTIEDVIDNVGKSVLGLTLSCARCHSHKYDPVTIEDYYALYGIFRSTKLAFPGCEPRQQPSGLTPLPGREHDPAPIRARIAALEAEFQKVLAKQEEAARALKGAPQVVLASGQIEDGGKSAFTSKGAVQVKKGELVMLSVTPLRNHGSDSTRVEMVVREMAKGGKSWDLRADVLDRLPEGNPVGPWHFLDAREGLRPMPELLRDFLGHKGLHVWRNGLTPSVFVNASVMTAVAWTSLPPRSVFLHPAADGPASIGWLSPIDGEVTIEGKLEDAHPGGPDGVGYWLQHFSADFTSLHAASKRAAKMRELAGEVARLKVKLEAAPLAFAASEGEARDAEVHLRGDPEKLGKPVPRRWLSHFGGKKVTSGSGRLDLAGWLLEGPLAARVLANRIWLHHFGKGLVATPNDFGTRGAPPTHPEVLDLLAGELIRSGWDIKHLHRLVLRTDAYRRASGPWDGLYSSFPRRRLSAEEIRDTLLTLGEGLDRSPGRAHPFPPESTWSFTQHLPYSTYVEDSRRSVYAMTLRNRRHPFFALFDGADPNACTGERQVTIVPTQALFFLNDPFVHRQSDALAARLLALPEAERIPASYRILFQRKPTAREESATRKFLTEYQAALDDVPAERRLREAWAARCRALLSSNELLFVD